MSIEIATLIAGVLIMVGAIIAGGAIYAGLEKLAKAMKNQKQILLFKQGLVARATRIRVGARQTIETLINEEALLLAKYLRDERKTWIPRIAISFLSE